MLELNEQQISISSIISKNHLTKLNELYTLIYPIGSKKKQEFKTRLFEFVIDYIYNNVFDANAFKFEELINLKNFNNENILISLLLSEYSDGLKNIDISNRNLDYINDITEKIVLNFDCSNNNLLSLENSPIIVFGNYNCSNNNNLISFKGCPKYILGDFIFSGNDKINSYEIVPDFIGGQIIGDYDKSLENLILELFKKKHKKK